MNELDQIEKRLTTELVTIQRYLEEKDDDTSFAYFKGRQFATEYALSVIREERNDRQRTD